MKFPKDFYAHLGKINYTEIKGGLKRDTFLEIWVVHVEERVFARSWNKSERSWFTAFLCEGVGELKYGSNILKVRGEKVSGDDLVHQKIDQAYMKRYGVGENIYYAQGISQPQYHDYTLEFFIE